MSARHEAALASLASVQTGPFGSQLHASDYETVGVPVVMPQDLGDNLISTSQIARVNASHVARLSRHRLTPGDIVFSRRGDVTRRALVRQENDGWLCGTGCLKVRPNAGVDAAFLSYAVSTEDAREWLVSHSVGATMPNLNTEILGRLPLQLPPLPEQQAIAEVLGALDDKIAANTKLATLALQLVDDSFPTGTEDTATRLGVFVEVTKGVSYRSADLQEGETALVTLKSVGRDGVYAEGGLKPYVGQFRPGQVVAEGEVVVAQTDLTQAADVVGRAVRVPRSSNHQKLVASLDLAIVRPRSGMDEIYLLGLLRQRRFREHCRSHTTGTTVLHLASGAIDAFEAQIVAVQEQRAYAATAGPLLWTIDAHNEQNRTLAATRDALLPQLMSGKLRVRDAERRAAEAGA